jgi:isopentenyldiphosphate isomerase
MPKSIDSKLNWILLQICHVPSQDRPEWHIEEVAQSNHLNKLEDLMDRLSHKGRMENPWFKIISNEDKDQ